MPLLSALLYKVIKACAWASHLREWNRLRCVTRGLKKSDGDGNENVKKALSLDWQNNNFARASRFFCTFLCRHCMTTS